MNQEWTEISSVAKDQRWVVMADIAPDGSISLAHVDWFMPEFDDWYLCARPELFTHWRYLDAPTQPAKREGGAA